MAAILLLGICAGSTARAEAPMDWYVAFKKAAKDARIAARQGRADGVRAFQVEAADLEARIAAWGPPPARAAARTICTTLAASFRSAVEEPWLAEARAAIERVEQQEEACIAAIRAR